MTKDDCQEMMKFAVLERDNSIEAAKRVFASRMSAINSMREMLESLEKSDVPLAHGEIADRVRLALEKIDGPFTLREICGIVRKGCAAGFRIEGKAVSGALRRMVGKELTLVENGRGKRGSTYEKAKTLEGSKDEQDA